MVYFTGIILCIKNAIFSSKFFCFVNISVNYGDILNFFFANERGDQDAYMGIVLSLNINNYLFF